MTACRAVRLLLPNAEGGPLDHVAAAVGIIGDPDMRDNASAAERSSHLLHVTDIALVIIFC